MPSTRPASRACPEPANICNWAPGTKPAARFRQERRDSMTRLSPPPTALVLALAAILPAHAHSARVLGDFRDWSSYAADDGSGTVCFAMTKPKTTEPTPENYGQAYLYITNRPGE